MPDRPSVVLQIHAHPNQRRVGFHWREDGSVDAYLRSRPQEGKANQELSRALAKTLGISTSSVVLFAGVRGKNKLLRIYGMSLESVRETIAAAPHPPQAQL